jgi:hypothetical protein
MRKSINKKAIEEWCDILESGMVEQCHGNLIDVEPDFGEDSESDEVAGYKQSYCCLGVLCEIAASKGIIDERKDHECGFKGKNQKDLDTSFLPKDVMAWMGFDNENPEVKYLKGKAPDNDGYLDLAEINDTYGESFKKIASLLRKEFLN